MDIVKLKQICSEYNYLVLEFDTYYKNSEHFANYADSECKHKRRYKKI
jgi:hypothetical protein